MLQIFTSKKHLAIMAFAMLCTTANAQQKSVTLTQAGTLSSQITAEEKFNITELSVAGPINGTDILFIRQMAGTDNEANTSTNGKLTHLNLQAASLVSGGGSYYFVKKGTAKKGYGVSENNLVDHYMFSGCEKLVEVKLPASTQKINNYAFFGCKSLTSCVIPASVDHIGDNAFANCKALKEVNIPAAVSYMGSGAFNNCTAIETVTFEEDCRVTEIRANAFNGCSALKSVKLSSGVEELGSKAFANCASLNTFTLPASFIEKAADTFLNTPIKNYEVEDGIEGFTSVGGVLYNEDQSELLLYPIAREDKSFIVPQSVGGIAEQAFAGAKNLTHITLSESITNIQSKTFAGSGLTEIVIPAEVTSISSEAFMGCNALTSVTFKGGPSGIGEKAFFGTRLSTVTFNVMNAAPELGKQAFYLARTQTTFFVPADKVETFKNALLAANAVSPSRFEVKALNTSSIEGLQQEDSAAEVSRYNAAGQRISAPVRGLNIVKMANGKTVKRIER
ncbi:leucine-rich repeat domain-containing protein [Segatella buccae]|uniref:leucine-rich repeat domain-containing protein n=1 Tax=Segatella buccae TaxID=28126 RepID=UPI0027B9104D|nr:leucine-rich repeat domain-containing protein [Segatella buccae]